MIESRYWRDELRQDISWLRKHRKYKRWSEKQVVLFERKLMLVAFQVRSLLERPKVNDLARSKTMPVLRFKKISKQPFTRFGPGLPDKRFDMEHPEPGAMSANDVCNQLIHHYWLQTLSEQCAFTELFILSDRIRLKCAYLFRVEDVLQLFQVYCDHQTGIEYAEIEWNDNKNDYVIVKSRGPQEYVY